MYLETFTSNVINSPFATDNSHITYHILVDSKNTINFNNDIKNIRKSLSYVKDYCVGDYELEWIIIEMKTFRLNFDELVQSNYSKYIPKRILEIGKKNFERFKNHNSHGDIYEAYKVFTKDISKYKELLEKLNINESDQIGLDLYNQEYESKFVYDEEILTEKLLENLQSNYSLNKSYQ